jgi:UTP--glucose-1-phosphate uridylyltransferase
MGYLINMKPKITKAVIPAAGLGTRFLPVTKAVPKEMIPIIDRPMIHYIVEEAIQSGIEDIVLITARHKEDIERYFDHNYELEDRLVKSGKLELAESIKKIAESCNIICVYQKEPAGLGHAVGCAERVVGKEPFAVLLGDDLIDAPVPCTQQLMRVYEQNQMSVVGVMEVAASEVSKYGIVAGTPLPGSSDAKTIRVNTMIEKPKVEEAPSRFAIPGRYVVDAKIFEYIKQTRPSKNGEIQFTDALLSLAKNEGLLAHQFSGDRYDTGDRLGYLDATLTFGLRRPELREGLMGLLHKHAKRNPQ